MAWSATRDKIIKQACAAVGIEDVDQNTHEQAVDWINLTLDTLSEEGHKIWATKEAVFSLAQRSEVLGTDGVNYTAIHSHTTPAAWSPLTSYNVGDIVSPNIVNGKFYQCVTSGWSCIQEPIWNTVLGSNNTDGRGTTVWSNGQSLSSLVYVHPSVDTGAFYTASSGTTGGSEPLWDITSGGATPDGTVTWQTYQYAVWETIDSNIPILGGTWRADWYANGTNGVAWTPNTKMIAPGNVVLPSDCARVVSLTHNRSNFDRPIELGSIAKLRTITLKGFFGWPVFGAVEYTPTGGTLRLWPLPDQTTDIIKIQYSAFIAYADDDTTTPDIPRIFIPYLIWATASNLAPSKGLEAPYIQILQANASNALQKAKEKNLEPITDNFIRGMY